MVDRLFGFYALLVVGSVAIVVSRSTIAAVEAIRGVVLAVTAVGTIGIIIVLLPGFTHGSLAEFLMGLPRVGGIAQRLVASLKCTGEARWEWRPFFSWLCRSTP